MTLADELSLSYYREIAPLNESHTVSLVLDIRDNRLRVKKSAAVYNTAVYRCLLEHPIAGMPRLYEVIEDGDRLITIEDYLQGCTLDQYIEQHAPLSEETVRAFALSLCRIVQSLHALTPPVIHRDIKPENILITDDGILKLLDLNAAKHSGTGEHRDTVLIGTEGYAAPEQYGFAPSNERTDIYAIGIVINVMLTGRLPSEENAAGALAPVIAKCTRMEPDARYTNIGEIIADLTPAAPPLPGSPIGAWAPPGFRSGKPLRKLFSAFGYIIALALLLTVNIASVAHFALWILRILLVFAFLGSVALIGNYRDIWQRSFLHRIQSHSLRVIVILALCILLFFFAFLIPIIIESAVIG